MNKKLKIGHVPEELRGPSLVPPIINAVISAIIPGLGQVLGRAVRRGILLFASFISIVALLFWRYKLEAPRDTGWINIIKKALRLDLFLIVVTALIVLLYLWIIYDAFAIATHRDRTPTGIFFMLVIVFFALGWQIGQINPIKMITGLDEGGDNLARVGWPWEKAITYPETYIESFADIQIPCDETPPPLNTAPEGEPLLVSTPTCGNLTEQDGTPGSELHLEGYNFIPGIEAQIMWEDPIGNTFRQRQAGEYVKAIPDEDGYFSIHIIMPYRLLPPSATEPVYIWNVFAQQIAAVGAAQPSPEFLLTIEKMVETIFIGMMATLFGIVFALPVSFAAARNLMSTSPITLVIYYIVRAILNIVRSIEPLIWAIIAVVVVGLGPFAGILALTLHSIAALGKLYSESIESIDPGPIEAIQATGATWLQTIIYAVIPQIIPPFVSFTIYRWDINIRMSTVIGFVGGGGIGFLLAQYIRLLDYDSAGMGVWFIAITVAILDYVSAEIRARYV